MIRAVLIFYRPINPILIGDLIPYRGGFAAVTRIISQTTEAARVIVEAPFGEPV